MTSVSISELKKNPASIFADAEDYPIAVLKRNKTTGYVVSKAMFEKMIEFVEDALDREVIAKTNFSKGTNLDEVLEELGL
ncbi:MAG: Prevent-host-death protein [Candidatus Woesebacteria bacterium GW2011_GWA2_44_33]|uniref:Antitoxin n=2 Tax=Candidatus Woeseibacteriota TaxID=1752722 RepID=A0A0G1NB28_9BACT|nr:MAG: Prevent-host-death protein [Candidatus Woesebacteria bacterium GW2011_GWA2_44_33]KKU17567.1 MAG: Prevent-host-death protein [Candidatus Woesebacteria bacterium GW2011_GWC2_45_9]